MIYDDIFSSDNPSIRQLETERAKDEYKQGEYEAIALEINKKYKKKNYNHTGIKRAFFYY